MEKDEMDHSTQPSPLAGIPPELAMEAVQLLMQGKVNEAMALIPPEALAQLTGMGSGVKRVKAIADDGDVDEEDVEEEEDEDEEIDEDDSEAAARDFIARVNRVGEEMADLLSKGLSPEVQLGVTFESETEGSRSRSGRTVKVSIYVIDDESGEELMLAKNKRAPADRFGDVIMTIVQEAEATLPVEGDIVDAD